jgi:peptide/nickel transport system permease protein
MLNFLVRRLAIGSLTLFLITFLIFGLIRNIPGTPLTVAIAETDPSRKLNLEDLERMKRSYGLDKPWPAAYVAWIGNLLQGDMGRSFNYKKPVTGLIFERMGPTLIVSVTSVILAYFIAIPLGLFATVRSGKLDERLLGVALYMLYSLPSFVGALFLVLIFYQNLHWLPLRGMTSSDYDTLSALGKFRDIVWHAVLPVTCYTYIGLAYDTRFIRANMEEAIRQDYIRTARAKGVSPLRVIVVHAFRNTLIPLVTMIGLTLPALLSGSVILERIFTWPGMGNLFFDAIEGRDYPVIMGLTLIFSALTLAGQLLADVLYAVVDPRINYS